MNCTTGTRKELLLLSQLGGFGWREIGDTLAPYFGEVHYRHKKGLLSSRQLGGFGWRDTGDTLALYLSIFSRLMQEADAFSLAGHLLLTCHTVLETVFVIGSLHTLPSVMMHEGDASFLVGHLWLVSIASP